jgi:C1A family cysteine protease
MGACTSNAIAAAIEFQRMEQKLDVWTPSRLFIYYNERLRAGTEGFDAGSTIRMGIKCVSKQGVTKEELWPYDSSRISLRPPEEAYADAQQHKAVRYLRVDRNVRFMRSVLAQGDTVAFGFSVYDSFESASVETTGVVPVPTPSEDFLGGHAVLMVGYDHQRRVFICRNSWGEEWGDKGYFYLPYEYITNPNLSDDFWAIQLVQ